MKKLNEILNRHYISYAIEIKGNVLAYQLDNLIFMVQGSIVGFTPDTLTIRRDNTLIIYDSSGQIISINSIIG